MAIFAAIGKAAVAVVKAVAKAVVKAAVSAVKSTAKSFVSAFKGVGKSVGSVFRGGGKSFSSGPKISSAPTRPTFRPTRSSFRPSKTYSPKGSVKKPTDNDLSGHLQAAQEKKSEDKSNENYYGVNLNLFLEAMNAGERHPPKVREAFEENYRLEVQQRVASQKQNTSPWHRSPRQQLGG